MEDSIVLNRVIYAYPGGFTLGPIDLEIDAREITFLMGLNGSGKSTLGKLIAGILRHSGGQLLFRGVNTRDMTLGQMGKRIGYLWQNPDFQIFAPTVWEEMTFLGALHGEDMRAVEKEAMYWLALLGLDGKKERETYLLSRGEKRRLALAAILMGGERFLLLDEPAGGLEPSMAERLEGILIKLRQQGSGMVVIGHDQKMAGRIANRIIYLEEGKVKYDIRPSR
jgi:energy-coupling factor transport system ATP-binding protein